MKMPMWFESFLRCIGLVPKSYADDAVKKLGEERERWMEYLKEAGETATKYRDMNDELTKLVEQCRTECEQLKFRISQMVNANVDNDEYIKEVQKQLSDVFHGSDMFKFQRSVAIPGSTSVNTYELETGAPGDKDYATSIAVAGRTIMDDQTTAKINNASTMYDKYSVTLNYLERNGIIESLARALVYHGGISLTLAYNSDCTCYEVYYVIETFNQRNNAILKFDVPTVTSSDKDGITVIK